MNVARRTVLAVGPRSGGVGDVFSGSVRALRTHGFVVTDRRPREAGSAAWAALQLLWNCRGAIRFADTVHVEYGSNDLAVFWFGVLVSGIRPDVVFVIHDPAKIAHAPGAGLIARTGRWRLRIAYRILSPALDRLLVRSTRLRAGVLVVLGPQARDALAKTTPRPVLYAPHGLDEAVGTETPAPPSACHDVLFAGYLGLGKGVDILIEAWSSLQDIPLTLTIAGTVGGTPASWMATLREAGARLANPPRWVGAVDDEEEFDALFQRAAIVVLPYRTSSPASGILVRAMAAGRCIVASRVEATVLAVEDGISGVLVEPSDAHALAKAIRTLASDPGRRDDLGQAAALRAQDRFGWDKFVATLQRAYAQAAEARPTFVSARGSLQ